jgi:ProP effector
MQQRPTAVLLQVLRKRWPKCFAWQRPGGGYRPLKIGIREEILATPDLGLTEVEVLRALANLTRKPCYLRRFAVGAARIDLDGNPAGVVTQDEFDHAQYWLRRRQAEAAAKAAAKPSGLADLKQAALARRARASVRSVSGAPA